MQSPWTDIGKIFSENFRFCSSSSIHVVFFRAITDPINYAQKRTVERVLFLIMGVWALSLLISSPPLIGWNDWPDEFTHDTPCQLTTNRGYVIYSSLGSFFIPLGELKFFLTFSLNFLNFRLTFRSNYDNCVHRNIYSNT